MALLQIHSYLLLSRKTISPGIPFYTLASNTYTVVRNALQLPELKIKDVDLMPIKN